MRSPCSAFRLAALLLAGTTGTAHAACPASNQFSFSFATAGAATLNYANTYTYTATNGLGQSQSFTVSFATSGLSSTQVAGIQMPSIGTLVNDGGTTNNNLIIGGIFNARTPAGGINSATRTIGATFTFATPVRDFAVQVNDIDYNANQFRDWLSVAGTNAAASYAPAIATPFATNNGTGARTNANSSLALGAATTPFAQSASEAIGTGASENNATTGTLTASFIQPVTTVTLRYGNYPLQSGETVTGQQAYGIQTVTFCPMPSLTVTKTSAPWSDPSNGTANPKLIPGGDLIYTLTVANSNSSPLDAATVLTDALPASVTFYNGDIDDAGPMTGNYEFVAGTSGLTFAATNLTYSNNGGTSYAYTPVTGYDPAVTALRFAPSGSMAANSSFSIRFRARIK